MQTENTLFDTIKNQYKNGGMTVRLIIINTLVFIAISIALVIERLAGIDSSISSLVTAIFTQETDPSLLIYRPWGIITNMFSHMGFSHFLFNMVFLYFFGRLFEQHFDQKRLLYTYILGGLFSGILEIIAQYFPGIPPHTIIGASGAIMAVVIAMLFHTPKTKVNLLGVFEVPLFVIGLIFILRDFVKLGINDGTAHFGHLGGAILGMISVQHVHSTTNIINIVQGWGDSILRLLAGNKQRRTSMRVQKKAGKPQTNARIITDEEYNMDAKTREEELNYILDKISKSGYPSLTKKEKDFLFRQSKK